MGQGKIKVNERKLNKSRQDKTQTSQDKQEETQNFLIHNVKLL